MKMKYGYFENRSFSTDKFFCRKIISFVFVLLFSFFSIFADALEDSVNKWRESGYIMPIVEGYTFAIGVSENRKTKEDALNYARQNLRQSFAQNLFTSISGKTEFSEYLMQTEGYTDLEPEAWAKMNTKVNESFFATLSGIHESEPDFFQNDDGTWNCTILGWMANEDIEKSKMLVPDEQTAKAVYGYFERVSLSSGIQDFLTNDDTGESYLTWIKNNCIRIIAPDSESLDLISSFNLLCEKLFRNVLVMQCSFENKNALVIYKNIYLKNLMDAFVKFNVQFSQNGNTLYVSSCNLQDLKNGIDSIKDSSTLMVFFNESIPSAISVNGSDISQAQNHLCGLARKSGFSVSKSNEKFSDMEDLISWLEKIGCDKKSDFPRFVCLLKVDVNYKSYIRKLPELLVSVSISFYDVFLKKNASPVVTKSATKRINSQRPSNEEIVDVLKFAVTDFFESNKADGLKLRLENIFDTF